MVDLICEMFLESFLYGMSERTAIVALTNGRLDENNDVMSFVLLDRWVYVQIYSKNKFFELNDYDKEN